MIVNSIVVHLSLIIRTHVNDQSQEMDDFSEFLSRNGLAHYEETLKGMFLHLMIYL